ncbi:hypothetical protein G9F31_03520 [Acinetobacter sp. 187]|uniref:hypothetical protein n=1 Tax=Acinetobacter lanii TaxID=2715163 RepID=UPI00140D20FD|nr:hypothetical protein [Acinetobacter lanii]NHC02842.1 hypothetical protein [Acinetobacter lanii]
MKTALKMGLCSIALIMAMPAMASNSDHQVRNDRVSVSKGIQQFDVNPFTDSKRVIRNDRVSYSHPNVETATETVAVQKHRYVRSDRVTITK